MDENGIFTDSSYSFYAITAVPLPVYRVARKQAVSPPSQIGGGKKEKREKKGTVWHDGSGGGKQLGQRAKEALDRSKVSNTAQVIVSQH